MLEDDIFACLTKEEFENLALKVFQFQYRNTKVYREFCDFLNISPASVKEVVDIPFLPIEFFKNKVILAQGNSSEKIFTSSGTTGSVPSKHHVAKLNIYERSFHTAFDKVYGDPTEYCILALLPSYLEREDSSLVYMVDALCKRSENAHSGFYMNNLYALTKQLMHQEETSKKTLLIGVSYALLDLVEKNKFQLQNTTVLETGGMKGRRKELVKDELHEILMDGFGVKSIHSEYGMTELLSQAYSQGHGVFNCPPWMKVLIRDTEDALTLTTGKTGGINIIDLANIYSCSFIATQDLGELYSNGSFKIIGRFDNSDIRGCNLMAL
jgi:hypothetical protein